LRTTPCARGVEHGLAIHQELVLVMAVVQAHLDRPGTVNVPSHGVGFGVPIVKVTNDVHTSGLGRYAPEDEWHDRFLGRHTVLLPKRMHNEIHVADLNSFSFGLRRVAARRRSLAR
jgi:hypothetical protein